MPEKLDECVQSVLEDNPNMAESRAYAICNAMNNRNELADVGECPEGEVSINGECKPIESISAPPSILQSDYEAKEVYQTADKHHIQPECALSILEDGEITAEDPCWEGYTQVGMKPDPNGSGEVPNCVPDDDVPDAQGYENSRVMSTRTLEVGPIERTESGSEVRYNNVALLGTGVWTDQASKTATLYDDATLENIEPEFNNSEHDGPPVNIMHDLSQNGEPNEASIGGYIDPKSLTAEGGKLYGDIVLDTTTAAGDFADENLQSALESNGQVGFGGPSVELDVPREHLAPATDHPEAEEHVEKGLLTGTGLVMDPASKNVSFDAETAARGVAMAASGDTNKTTHVLTKSMATVDDVRGDLEQYNIDTEGMTDEDIMEFAEGLHSDLMDTLEDVEMEDGEDMEDEDMEDMEEDEDEEDENMGDYSMEDMEEMAAQVEEMRERLSELEAEMGNTASMSDVESELAELAEADTVEELDKRLSNLEEQPEESKTLAEDNTVDEDKWAYADSGHSSSVDGSFGR